MHTGSPKVPTKADRSAGRAEHGQRRSSSQRAAPQQEQQQQQQQQAQRDGSESIETISRSEAPAQEQPQFQQQHQQDPSGIQHGRYIQESGETTAATAGTEARTHEERGYLPEFGIMGLPMVDRAESLSSSEKYVWWGYDEHEQGPGGVFTGSFWRRRFSTRAAVLNTLKHAATTSLGLLIILAIALTALGKIKNRDQVSDSIPHSLDGTIMEAQVVVVKDLSSLQKLKVATGSGTVAPGEQDALDQLETITIVETSRIPIWTDPIRKECFQKKCDLKSFGKEFFAFMASWSSIGIFLRIAPYVIKLTHTLSFLSPKHRTQSLLASNYLRTGHPSVTAALRLQGISLCTRRQFGSWAIYRLAFRRLLRTTRIGPPPLHHQTHCRRDYHYQYHPHFHHH